MNSYRHLPGRFLIGFALVMVTVWMLTWSCVYFIGHIERHEAVATARNTSLMVSAYVAQTLKAGTIAIDSMRTMVSDRGIETDQQFRDYMNEVDIQKMLKNRIMNIPEIDKLAFISNDGQVLNFSLKFPPPPIRVADRDYFIEQMGPNAPATSLSVVVVDRGSGKRVFYLAQKIVSGRGAVLGLAIAAIDADFVTKFFHRTALGGASAIFLTRSDGTLLTGVGLQSDAYGSRLTQSLVDMIGSETGYVRRLNALPTTFEMTSFAAACQPVEGLPARIAVVIGNRDIYATWWPWFAGVMTLSVLLVLSIAFVFWRLLVMLGQLLETSKAAQAANNAKSQFITNMSHELRTPLNGILGMFRLLDKKTNDQESKLFVETGSRSAEHLLSIVNDMLDLSKVEAGCMEIDSAPFAVGDMARHAVAIMYPSSKERGNQIDLTVAANVPDRVVGDEGRWRQVLLNVLGNAVKFTENGKISVHVDADRTDDGAAVIRFVVTDTGIGIPKSVQSQIFNKFFQADSSIQRQFGGTGLGLAISRLIIQKLNGQIGFESEPGQGSVFRVEIPCVPVVSASGKTDQYIEHISRSLRILSAEDSPTNQLVVQHFLSESGHECEAVSNGAEAVRSAERTDYDVILMDVQMPEMDGIEATRRIRELSGRNHTTPVVIVTAHAMAGDREKFLAAGADDYLSKPISPAALKAVLARVTSQRRSDLGLCLHGVSAAALA